MRRAFFFVGAGAALVLVVVLAVNTFIYESTKKYMYTEAALAPAAQAVLIPGAAILIDGGLSPIFRDRADAAITLYEAGRVAKILVSGDNSTVSHNEVNPVRKYLLAKGVPGQDIFLDHAGFDTYSSMYRARAVFGVSSMLVVSQSFHLPRASRIHQTRHRSLRHERRRGQHSFAQ